MRNREEAAKKARELVGRMTIEEKASQLRYDAPAIERLNIPAYNWWNEALHGVARAGTATSFPQAIALAAAFDRELMKKIGETVAEEGRAKYNASSARGDRDIYKGLTFWSPNVNIFRDPRWGRGQETYGEDPFLTGRLGVEFIKGVQGDGETMKAAACAKHFAVHSGPEELRHQFDAKASKKDMFETYLPAFEACVKEGEVEAVMGAYNRTNGQPCCGSPVLMQELLREKWGFKGHYVSDCWAVRDFHEHHYVTSTPQESAALALKSGCDVNCGCTYIMLMKAFEEGLVTEQDITEAAVRLFTTRFLLGLFDGSEYDAIPYERVECAEHIALAERAARESIVLLKNDGILPLEKSRLKAVGVVGPNADSRVALVGNYHGTASRYTTVLEGIQDYIGNDARVFYSSGCELWKDRAEGLAFADDRLSEARAVAENSDVVIVCVGLDETMEGEEMDTGNGVGSGDKADLKLPAVQQRLLETIARIGKPFVVCLMSGSAIDLSFAQERANAVVQLWYPGARGGKAAAELLFGDFAPSGKLPITFYRELDDMPDFTDYAMTNRTYRFLQREPLYPFGFGLTYGSMELSEASVEKTQNGGAKLRVKIKNLSGRTLSEVVQVYVKDVKSPLAVKNHSLCGFERAELAAGESAVLAIEIPQSAFTVVTENGDRVIDSDLFELYVGFGQPDERTFALTGSRPLKLTLNY